MPSLAVTLGCAVLVGAGALTADVPSTPRLVELARAAGPYDVYEAKLSEANEALAKDDFAGAVQAYRFAYEALPVSDRAGAFGADVVEGAVAVTQRDAFAASPDQQVLSATIELIDRRLEDLGRFAPDADTQDLVATRAALAAQRDAMVSNPLDEARAAAERGDTDEAVRLYTEALEDPELADTAKQALIALHLARGQEAVERTRQACATSSPADPTTLEPYREAESMFAEVQQLDPNNASARAGSAELRELCRDSAPPPPPTRSRRPLAIGLLVSGAVSLAGGAGLLGYGTWFIGYHTQEYLNERSTLPPGVRSSTLENWYDRKTIQGQVLAGVGGVLAAAGIGLLIGGTIVLVKDKQRRTAFVPVVGPGYAQLAAAGRF